MSADTLRGQKRESEPLELALQAAVNPLMCGQGTEVRASARVTT